MKERRESASEPGAGGKGTAVQRFRAGLVEAGSELACRLPERFLVAAADSFGLAWYRLAPARAARARRNLRRVAEWLAARGCGPVGARAAATDDGALERLVRAAFRHQARYYLELARVRSMDARYIRERLTIETPETVAEAFGGDGRMIFVGLHFGALELPALLVRAWTGKVPTAPMETIADPALQRYFVRSRGSIGVTIVRPDEARHALQAALARHEPVGLIADRDVTGSGHLTELFGHPAPLPIGVALVAIESAAPVYMAGVRRTGAGRYAGGLEPVAIPTDGSVRQKVTAILEAEARGFERIIAEAPEQWWAVFFPIWPDLEDAA